MTVLLGLSARLRLARLYLCTDARQKQGDLADFLGAAFAGGVDIMQIRQPGLSREAELAVLQTARAAAGQRGIVCLRGSAKRAGEFSADVMHLGEGDGPAPKARKHLHQWALLGRSTHTSDQIGQAVADPDVDYLTVGPVFPAAGATGLDLIREAVQVAPVFTLESKPWFAAGGISLDQVDAVIAAGARRICVMRAITEASDPAAAARELRARVQQAWRADPATERYSIQAAAGAGPSR